MIKSILTLVNLCLLKIEAPNRQWQMALLLGISYFVLMIILPVSTFSDVNNTVTAYVDFSSPQSAAYPFILDIIELIKLPWEAFHYIQLLLFSLTLAYFCFVLLSIGMPLLLPISFVMGLAGNFYFGRFHLLLMPDSLIGVILLLLIIASIKYLISQERKYILWQSICVGLLVTLHKANTSFLVGLTLFVLAMSFPYKQMFRQGYFLQKLLPWGKFFAISVCLPIILIISLERTYHYAYHGNIKKPELGGTWQKMPLIMAFSDFQIEKLPPPYQQQTEQVRELFSPAKIWLDDIPLKSPRDVCFKLRMLTGFESMIHSPNSLASSLDNFHHTLVEFNHIFLKTYPVLWFKNALVNYFATSCITVTGHYSDYLEAYPPPFLSENETQSFNPTQLPIIIYYFFFILGMMVFACSLFYASWWILSCFKRQYRCFMKTEILAMHMLLWIHGYNFFIGLFVAFLPRYLMPVYPLMILVLLLTAFAWLERLRTRLRVKSS